MDSTILVTGMMMLHYTKQNNGNVETPVTLEHMIKWMERFNKKNKKKDDRLKITSLELA